MKYSAKQYALALGEILQSKQGEAFSKSVQNFLQLLKKNNQRGLLPKILREVKKLEEGGVAVVFCASGLSPGSTDHLKKILQVEKVEQKTAPELLGGAVIEWEDWQLDASVRGRLNRLRAGLEK